MKKFLLLLLIAVAAFPLAAMADDSVYERVMKSGTIRCAYAIWKPILYKDANSGEIRGFAHDLVEDIGRRLDLKIEWTEETGWGNLAEGLATGRYDLACTGMYLVAARSRRIDFSRPLFFSPMLVAVRADETRLKKNSELNDAAYKIAVLEGEASSVAARQTFPKAGTVALPQLTDYTQVYEEVRTGKADATLIEAATFAEYDHNNPGVLKILDKTPVNIFPVVLSLPPNDAAFKRIIDAALSEQLSDGTVDRLLSEHEDFPGTFYRLSKPYEVPQ